MKRTYFIIVFLILAIIAVCSIILADTAGPAGPHNATTNTSIGSQAWGAPANIYAYDGVKSSGKVGYTGV